MLEALEGLLLRPSMTLAVGSAVRPVLLSFVSDFVRARVGGALQPGMSHAAVSVALISLLELAPHLDRWASWVSCAGLQNLPIISGKVEARE